MHTPHHMHTTHQKLLEMAGIATELLSEALDSKTLNQSVTQLDKHGIATALTNSNVYVGDSILEVDYIGATRCGRSECYEHNYAILVRGDDKYQYDVNKVVIFLNKDGNIAADFTSGTEDSFGSTSDASARKDFFNRYPT